MFLIEGSEERLACLLNPESLELRRRAGIQARRLANGVVAGAKLADDPLVCTGGGSTELHLDLLFDVGIAGSSQKLEDVRALTRPFWQLSEHGFDGDRPQVPVVRFIWGKGWNIPGVVAAVAERLEHFSPGGIPRRSWLRMRFLRVAEPALPIPPELPEEPGALVVAAEELNADPTADLAELPVHEIIGDGDGGGDRLDQLAHRFYGNAGFWRVLAAFNGLDQAMELLPGSVLRIPTLAMVLRHLAGP
jgi:Contractile injection system tube protein